MTIYMNRELSWLKFNERVLEEAGRKDTPLCERLNFASIYQSNLDEFFMVRVGSLADQMLVSSKIRENKTHMTAAEQIDAIIRDVRRLNGRKEEIYSSMMEDLEDYGVRVVDFHKINEEESSHLERYFDKEISPLLCPIVVGKRQPFPFLRNKEIYAVVVLGGKNKKRKLGIIPCGTDTFDRVIKVCGEENSYMLSEELILHFISKVFQGYQIVSKSLIRLTRNADIDADALYDDDADTDYRDFMEEMIKRRRRLSPVRLEISRELDDEVIKMICENSEVDPKYVFHSKTPLDLSFLGEIQDSLRGNLSLYYDRRFPQKSCQFMPNVPVLDQIKVKDKLLSYPYNSMKPFLDMLREAAVDPDVISIKMTLYRVARNSEVVQSLIEAAENGKNVIVLVELKARFDEENNIGWSRRLENAGCQVIYGLDGYKVHSKLCLITRRHNNKTEYITQVGTGNYNEKTARLYTDLSVMTANNEIGQEANTIFQALSKGETVKESNYLLVAPHCLQNRIIEMINDEIFKARAGKDAYIGIKINSLTDKRIIDKLVDASKAGVKIELIVRGICCLRPGVPGKTDNITVRSIVGRFLEHSRIYIFGSGLERKVYISSADFMTRNTLRRVEVSLPVLDHDLNHQITEMFRYMMMDNTHATELKNSGYYEKVTGKIPFNSQEFFYKRAYDQAYLSAETTDAGENRR